VNRHLDNAMSKTVNRSKYGHFTGQNRYYEVDWNSGKYVFDCCGFVKYMLIESGKKQEEISFLGGGRKNRSGSPGDWVEFAKSLKQRGGRVPGWVLAKTPQPGDILMTSRHVMISMGTPQGDTLKIADSTSTPHREGDTRGPGRNGMGKGYIRVRQTSHGWEHAWNPKATDWTPMYFVRPVYN